MNKPKKEIEVAEVEEMLDEAVNLGHAEKDSRGRYRLTSDGITALAADSIFELFECPHNQAYTFGALVTATGLAADAIVAGLVDLINSDVLTFGTVVGKNGTNIFYLNTNSNQLRAFVGEGESPGHFKYGRFVNKLLLQVTAASSKNACDRAVADVQK